MRMYFTEILKMLKVPVAKIITFRLTGYQQKLLIHLGNLKTPSICSVPCAHHHQLFVKPSRCPSVLVKRLNDDFHSIPTLFLSFQLSFHFHAVSICLSTISNIEQMSIKFCICHKIEQMLSNRFLPLQCAVERNRDK